MLGETLFDIRDCKSANADLMSNLQKSMGKTADSACASFEVVYLSMVYGSANSLSNRNTATACCLHTVVPAPG